MREYIELGSTPANEDCAQVGQSDYESRSRTECHAFVKLLRAVFGEEPEGARLAVKSFPHDFGTYREVVCHYDSDLPESFRYAMKCEAETPTSWIYKGQDFKAATAKEALYAKELSTPEQIVMDGDREVECGFCGTVTAIEPDASEFWCEGCKAHRKAKSCF